MNNTANTIGFEDGVRLHDLPSEQGADVTIICMAPGADGRYSFIVIPQGEMPSEGGVSSGTFDAAAIEGFLQNLIAQTTPLTRSYDLSQVPSVRMQIAGIGAELQDQLIPATLRLFISELAEGATIDISTREMWIPWEILYDHEHDEFWGVRYNLRRCPKVPLNGKAEVGRKTGSRLKNGRIQQAINVIGDQLNRSEVQGAESTFAACKESYNLTVIPSVNEPIHRLKQRLDENATDILHFTCHGISDAQGLHLRLGPNIEHQLTPLSIKNLSLDGGLVFANACASASPTRMLNEFTTFGWRFYVAGAEAFIGTLVPIPAAHAITFARDFYQAWRPDERSCSTTLRELKKSKLTDASSLFALFYCLYGKP